MSDWNPALYTRYEEERTRPAHELLARVPTRRMRRVVDLGCGPGNSTALLAERYPNAEIVGIDNSPAMLSSARERLPSLRFELADIAQWEPANKPDLIYTNAALQWVGCHEALLQRLMHSLGPNGVLAVQMPDNLDEPSHSLMREVAAQAPWAAAIGDAGAVRDRLLPLARYYDVLTTAGAQVDLWRTTYQHVMPSAAAITDWLRATGLRPFTDRLPEAQREAYLAAYTQRIADAYPPRADGGRLLAFPRLFFVAARPS